MNQLLPKLLLLISLGFGQELYFLDINHPTLSLNQQIDLLYNKDAGNKLKKAYSNINAYNISNAPTHLRIKDHLELFDEKDLDKILRRFTSKEEAYQLDPKDYPPNLVLEWHLKP